MAFIISGSTVPRALPAANISWRRAASHMPYIRSRGRSASITGDDLAVAGSSEAGFSRPTILVSSEMSAEQNARMN